MTKALNSYEYVDIVKSLVYSASIPSQIPRLIPCFFPGGPHIASDLQQRSQHIPKHSNMIKKSVPYHREEMEFCEDT